MSKLSRHKYFFPALLLLLWMLALLVIDPRGEFPVNDDWAYSKNVYELSVNHRFVVDDWPAMNLVSQTLYGSIFTSVFGFSFQVLRLSMLFLGIISSLVLYRLLKKLCGHAVFAFMAATSYVFSVLFCALAFTFMTDVFFVSFMIFAIDVLVTYLQTKQNRHYWLFCFYCLVATLDRQHGLLLPLLVILPLLWKQKIHFRNTVRAFLPLLICIMANSGFRFLLQKNNISHNIQGLGNLRKSIANMSFETLHIHAGDLLLVTAMVIGPVLVLLLVGNYRFKPVHLLLIGLSLALAWGGIYKDWIFYPQGNVARYLEVGPRIVQGEHFFGAAHEGTWGKFAVRILAFFSLAGLFFMVMIRREKQNVALGLGMLVFAFVYFVFVIFNTAYFDRYALPLALVMLLYLIPQKVQLTKTTMWVGIPLLCFVYLVSVAEVHDHMGWQRSRWQALEYLHQKGIGPQETDGGFEYNGWFKPGKGYEPGKSWWWVDRDNYIISRTKVSGYSTDTIFVTQRWIPFETDTIFVLKK